MGYRWVMDENHMNYILSLYLPLLLFLYTIYWSLLWPLHPLFFCHQIEHLHPTFCCVVAAYPSFHYQRTILPRPFHLVCPHKKCLALRACLSRAPAPATAADATLPSPLCPPRNRLPQPCHALLPCICSLLQEPHHPASDSPTPLPIRFAWSCPISFDVWRLPPCFAFIFGMVRYMLGFGDGRPLPRCCCNMP